MQSHHPDVLVSKYRDLSSISYGGSSAQTFSGKTENGGDPIIIKYADWEGIDGNGMPWLRMQAKALKNLHQHLPKAAKDLFPEVLEIVETDEYIYYTMPFYQGRTMNRLICEDLCMDTKEFFSRLDKVFKCLCTSVYTEETALSPEKVIEKHFLDRMEGRTKLMFDRESILYNRIISGNPVEIGTGSYADTSFLFEDLLRKDKIFINGKQRPNLPHMLKALRSRQDILRRIEPAKLSKYYHGDLILRNIFVETSENIRLIDNRTFPTRKEMGDIIYDLGKLTFSCYFEIVREGWYNVHLMKRTDGIFSIDLDLDVSKSKESIEKYKDIYREMLYFFENNEELNAYLKEDKEWRSRLQLAEASHFIADMPCRLEHDAQGYDSLAFFVLGTQRLFNFLVSQGIDFRDVTAPENFKISSFGKSNSPLSGINVSNVAQGVCGPCYLSASSETKGALDDVAVVVLAGGKGTRLWPVSREDRPKPFVDLNGDGSLLQKTVRRYEAFLPANRIFIHAEAEEEAKKQLPKKSENIIAMPRLVPLTASIAYDVLRVRQKLSLAGVENPTLIVTPSDHRVSDDSELFAALRQAVVAAQNKPYSLVTIGLKPDTENIENFGYIGLSAEPLDKGTTIYEGINFIEKPERSKAKHLIEDGYRKNSGLLVFSVSAFLDAVHNLVPTLSEEIKRVQGGLSTPSEKQVVTEYFDRTAELSINSIESDIIQKIGGASSAAGNITVVTECLKLEDVGLWGNICESNAGNSCIGEGNVQMCDSTGVTCYAEAGLRVIVNGAENIIVVMMNDAALIMDRTESMGMRRVIERMNNDPEQRQYLKTTTDPRNGCVLEEDTQDCQVSTNRGLVVGLGLKGLNVQRIDGTLYVAQDVAPSKHPG